MAPADRPGCNAAARRVAIVPATATLAPLVPLTSSSRVAAGAVPSAATCLRAHPSRRSHRSHVSP